MINKQSIPGNFIIILFKKNIDKNEVIIIRLVYASL